ncbi:hypothetical protein DIPPA_29531 [Diplonema papillatum]|nr:hypothetical protein DIPPA_18357 [Diplonema papillatum]KAJ9440960.1 hypothetical protein DIPPA_00441 [Diplonema papillatum]KAJ9448452.1 hypothetical protein DIPPA_10558 [Diplonema papillatum]KAJ9473513.1 hypothetical protein DIPPA_29531 [Diplonema papillatum]
MYWDIGQLAFVEGEFSDEEWRELTVSLQGLPVDFPLLSLRNLPYNYLPGPCRPKVSVYLRLQGLLRGAGGLEEASRETRKIEGTPRGRPAKAKLTAQRRALRSALRTHVPERARDHIRSLYTAAKTKAVYSSNTAEYVAWCSEDGVEPYPTSVRRLEVFGGCLSLMESSMYKTPHALIKAIVAENLARGFVLHDPVGDIPRLLRALEKEAPDTVQKEPLGLEQFRHVFRAVRSVDEYSAALQLLGEHFTLLRSCSMQSIRTEDIRLSKDRVRVVWHCSKGRGNCTRELCFDRIDLVPPLLLPDAPNGAPARIRYCPVEVFSLLKKMALARGAELLCPFPTYAKYYGVLCGTEARRGVLDSLRNLSSAGRCGNPYGTHSARVGGCCTLLKAGMDPDQVVTMGDWADAAMIRRYGEKVLRDPHCVQAVRFYCPVTLAHVYTSRGAAL